MASMQPQTTVNMTTLQPQPQVVMPMSCPVPAQHAKYLKAVRGLAISELVLGSICVLVGIILVGLVSSWYGFTIGEGIWCGIWVIVAGALGIPAAAQNSNRCLITCHMAFSIVGAVFSATLFGTSTGFIFAQRSTASSIFQILLSLLSFASMVLLIISSSYCCYLIPGCCRPYAPGQGQVVYVATNSQPPMLMQQPGMPVGVPGTQTYVIQGFQPVPQMVQHPGMPAMPAMQAVLPQAVPPLTNQNAPQNKDQDPLVAQVAQPSSYPPSYSLT